MPDSNVKKTHIAIAGGGFTGLVCALKLLQAGYQVTILEAQDTIGGLSGSFDFGPFRWDRFYHCILTSDSALLALLDELGMTSQLHWTATEVGLFSHGQLFKMSGPLDLLRFPHLSLWSKARLVVATLYASHIRNGDPLERESLSKWTIKLFGETVYREMWEPLFRCKLGEMRHHASAAFLWGTLRRLYSTREKGPNKQERLGYVHGGYAAVFSRLLEKVEALGADIVTGAPIRKVTSRTEPDDPTPVVTAVHTDLGLLHCDGVIMTVPARVLAASLETEDLAYKQRLAEVRYLGMVCVVLILRRQLSPFYVTNITAKVPFTGVIEMTNLIDPGAETSGYHLVYLPRYTMPDDPLFTASDDDVWETFLPDLQQMHPTLVASDIVKRLVFRERTVQPVPTLNYSRIAPPPQTPEANIYVVNTAQIINNTLNNNVMTELATAACNRLIHDIPSLTPVATEMREPCLP